MNDRALTLCTWIVAVAAVGMLALALFGRP